jgi:hypothetical protein
VIINKTGSGMNADLFIHWLDFQNLKVPELRPKKASLAWKIVTPVVFGLLGWELYPIQGGIAFLPLVAVVAFQLVYGKFVAPGIRKRRLREFYLKRHPGGDDQNCQVAVDDDGYRCAEPGECAHFFPWSAFQSYSEDPEILLLIKEKPGTVPLFKNKYSEAELSEIRTHLATKEIQKI